ncbi:hypothetical protein HELRODRAFT_171606 [Helobdella robusta]|uniref:Uncharacterized protein n=1 Tax=Helobdella robusta TaxID=6412 RepID=T1F4G4_HELRO|nr:hypothetical protein HELRODRAFT_171606 [Helobdella robusta]ESO05248.1 hypothetical protein HELRODRAFT_171606 [Helobdella robusta]
MRCVNCSGSGKLCRLDVHGQKHLETCWHCRGTGRKKCSTCSGDGRLLCEACDGCKSVKSFNKLHVQYKNLYSDYIISPSEFPEQLLKEANGVYLLDQIQPKLKPITDETLDDISLSSQTFHQQHIIKSKNSRIIMQRQRIKLVPLSECSYNWLDVDGTFWIYGKDRQIHAPDNPQQLCWGYYNKKFVENHKLWQYKLLCATGTRNCCTLNQRVKTKTRELKKLKQLTTTSTIINSPETPPLIMKHDASECEKRI